MSTLNITITLDTDGASFEDDPGELGFLLRVIAERIAADHADGASGEHSVLDTNGNSIGTFRWQDEPS